MSDLAHRQMLRAFSALRLMVEGDVVDGLVEMYEETRRTPVTPIPVSEPPGDNDIVVPLWIKPGDEERPDLWAFATGKGTYWSDAIAFEPRISHYLLLRKGE